MATILCNIFLMWYHLMRRHLSNDLLWSLFQSSLLHNTSYISYGPSVWVASMPCMWVRLDNYLFLPSAIRHIVTTPFATLQTRRIQKRKWSWGKQSTCVLIPPPASKIWTWVRNIAGEWHTNVLPRQNLYFVWLKVLIWKK